MREVPSAKSSSGSRTAAGMSSSMSASWVVEASGRVAAREDSSHIRWLSSADT